MRTIYSKKGAYSFWQNKWVNIEKDPDKLTSPEDYPLNPISQYIKSYDKIAEIGCGCGRFYKHYFYAGYDIVGMDYIPEAIYKLKQENSLFNVNQGNVLSLEYEDNTFDVTVAFGTLSCLNNINDVKKGLSECVRITKPGGIVCTSINLDNFGAKVLNFKNTFGVKKRNREPHVLAFKKQEYLTLARNLNIIPILVSPIYSKINFYNLSVFRSKNSKNEKFDLRDGEFGFHLNWLGDAAFNTIKKLSILNMAHGCVYIFRKYNKL